MKIYRVTPGNFGDDLNETIIEYYLGNVFEGNVFLNKSDQYDNVSDDDTLIIAIGTILNQRVPECGNKVVLGAGTGYGLPPKIDHKWQFEFVRGPLTAKRLGLSIEKAITDPAILVADFYTNHQSVDYKFGYVPHHGCANDSWKLLCEELGILYIDIRRSFEQVMNDISRCEVVLTEAMHAAIVADTLRIPWIAIKTADKINDFKWHDWCESMGLNYRPHQLHSLWRAEPGIKSVSSSLLKRSANRYKLKKIMKTAIPALSTQAAFESKRIQVKEYYDVFFTGLINNYFRQHRAY